MLYHHDSRSYDVAASEAASSARERLEALIERGKGRALRVVEQVFTQVPHDRVRAARAIDVDVDAERGIVLALGDGAAEGLHRHAAGQLAARAEIPRAYVDRLQTPEVRAWGLDLLAHNLREILRHDEGKLLLRSVDAEVRGILSDRYKRLDSRPLVEAFCGAVDALGAVPVEGYATETKIGLKAMLPMVFEPVRNEVMCFGVMLGNSDFGNGALELSSFITRLWCTNHAILETPMRKVHLGSRLNDDLTYSQRTYELETELVVSQLGDIVRNQLSPARVNELCDGVRRAHEQKVSARDVEAFLAKHTTKAEAEAIVETFKSPEIERVPEGSTRWRMSNAISWIAGKTVDEERKMELMKLAGVAARVPAAKPAIVEGSGALA